MTPEKVTAAVGSARLRPFLGIELPSYHYAAIFEKLPAMGVLHWTST